MEKARRTQVWLCKSLKASCGVRTLIACQFRFSTSTIDLVSRSVIKYLRAAPFAHGQHAHREY